MANYNIDDYKGKKDRCCNSRCNRFFHKGEFVMFAADDLIFCNQMCVAQYSADRANKIDSLLIANMRVFQNTV